MPPHLKGVATLPFNEFSWLIEWLTYLFTCVYSFVDRLELIGDESERDITHDVTVTCLSCPTAEDVASSSSCQFVDAHFSPSAEFYVDACLGPQLPRYVLKSATDHLQRNRSLSLAYRPLLENWSGKKLGFLRLKTLKTSKIFGF